MFDEFQSCGTPETRRPRVDNLYDVFVNIRDDEGEHVKTMIACQKPDAQKTFKSPRTLAYGEQKVVLPRVSDIEVEAELATPHN